VRRVRPFLVVSIVLSAALPAQQRSAEAALPRGFLAEKVTVAGVDHPYVLYVPRAYTPARRWPLILFLHGAGECGDDGMLQLAVGLAPAILRDALEWPFLVLMPQKPDRRSAWEDHDAMLLAMLERTQKEYSVDPRQRFLTGLSQGGHGTWVLGGRHADLWAAIAPVCGYGDPTAIAPGLQKTPIWCFHGDADKSVSVQQSKDLVAAVQAASGSAELTIYPGVGHDSWVKAYGEAGLGAWFLEQGARRVLQTFTARPETLLECHVELRRDWKGGTQTLRVDLDRGGLRWESVTENAPEGCRGRTWTGRRSTE